MKTDVLPTCYQEMLETRLFQEKLLSHGIDIYTDKGEEAITIGTCQALKAEDIISCYFRGEGSVIRLKGAISLEEQMCCWLGRKGEQDDINAMPPSSWTDVDHGVIGTSSSLIGADADIATGVALAQKMQKTGNVVVFMSGDGASSKGNFHEMFNWAGEFTLPLIVMIRGNQWAMSTPVENDIHVSSIIDMVKPYGFLTFECDGNDVAEVYDTVQTASDYAREKGPVLIYARTYRMSPHSAHDDDEYRDPKAIKEWEEKDPILLAEQRLQEAGYSREQMNQMRAEEEKRIEDAYQYALSRPEIQLDEYLQKQEDVVKQIEHNIS